MCRLTRKLDPPLEDTYSRIGFLIILLLHADNVCYLGMGWRRALLNKKVRSVWAMIFSFQYLVIVYSAQVTT
jgi:hypothetical protein